MKRKHKGRKIYKTKEKNYYGKSPMGKFLSAALTVLLIGGIGFIGYSVAEPVINYTQHKGDVPDETTTDPTDAEGADTTDPSAGEGEKKAPEQYRAAALDVTDLANKAALKTALSAVPRNAEIEYVQVPLKVRGGNVYFSTTNQQARACEAVSSPLSLAEITSEIEASGFKPSAEISAFYDNLLPKVLPTAGYVTVDDGSQWVDDDPKKGGKPWTSPTSEDALSYVASFIDEAADAGFERIVCTDIMYPYFRESDLALLDPQYGRSDRFMALTSAANLFYDRAVSDGASMYVGVSAADMLMGSYDVLQPKLLSSNSIVLDIDVEELKKGVSDGKMLYEFEGTPAEITEKCLSFLSDKLTDLNVTVRISGYGVTAEELLSAKEKAAGCGYTSFVIG